MADTLHVNGNQVSWGSLIFKLNNDIYRGFTAISFSDKRERVKAYGMGRHHAPRGRSSGKYTIEPLKVTGWKSSVQALRRDLAAASGGTGYGDIEFNGVLQYIEANDDDMVVEFERLVWMSNTTSDEESPDPLKEEFELDCMYIRRNQLVLFDASGGEP